MKGQTETPKLQNDLQIDYAKILRILWSRWYWIAGCIILALTVAYAYLWYTPPVYSTSASLKFNEKQSEISAILKKSDEAGSVQSEIFVIQSKEVLLNAISQIDYKISYYLQGRVRTSESYPEIPFPIDIILQDSIQFNTALFDIKNLGDNQFEISYYNGQEKTTQEHTFGDTIKAPGVVFRVIGSTAPENSEYNFRFNKPETFLKRVAGGLSITEAAKSSNVLMLTQKDNNPAFAADILNAILAQYINTDGALRSRSASQTIEFIEGQLQFLSAEVRNSGNALEIFKRSNGSISPSTSADLKIKELTQFKTQQSALKIEELAIDQLEQQVLNNANSIALNFNLEGSLNPLLGELIKRLNVLLTEREEKLTRFNVGSQPINELDQKIGEIKKSVITNVKLLRERNDKTLRYLNSQINVAENSLTSLPSAERDFINLQSDFDINQKVFSLLAEKKLEAQITKAAVVPGATIINEASPQGRLVQPIAAKIYTSALLIGLIAGVAFIVLARLSNPYIFDKETVETLTSTPIIGIIRKFPSRIDKENREILSLEKPKSVFAESVRSVRTNLSFLASEKKSKIICVTSEIAGEGKSFVAINLASTLALIDKKVLLVAADLRKSKLHKTFETDNTSGLSTYLSHQSKASEIILTTKLTNVDFISSGPIPPNPSELLYSTRMRDLLEEMKHQYDFILIDTAPVGLVSDAIPVIRYSDINLFVIRSGVSRYNSVSIPERISTEYGLNNVVIVLNAFGDDVLHGTFYSSSTVGHYNTYYYSDYSGYYGAGYYVEDRERKFWQIWKKLRS